MKGVELSTGDIPTMQPALTTKRLAEMYGVKPNTVIENNYLHGQFRGYIPVRRERKKHSQLIWEKQNG